MSPSVTSRAIGPAEQRLNPRFEQLADGSGKRPAHHPLTMFLAADALLIALVLVVWRLDVATGISISVIGLLSLIAVVVVLSVVKVARSGDPFHPAGLLVLYPAAALTVSAMYAVLVGFMGGFLPGAIITPRVFAVVALFCAGLAVAPVLVRGGPDYHRPPPMVSRSPFLVGFGHLFLVIAAVMRLVYLRAQGLGSFASLHAEGGSAWSVISSLIPLIGVTMLILVNRQRLFLHIGIPAALLLGVWAGASLLIGTRDEVLGPVILLAWAVWARDGRVGWTKLATLAVVGFVGMAAIGVWRSPGGQARWESRRPSFDRLPVRRTRLPWPWVRFQTHHRIYSARRTLPRC
ncbi:MAG: hypothetical protein ACK5MP_06120 [Nostocoides sp.]